MKPARYLISLSLLFLVFQACTVKPQNKSKNEAISTMKKASTFMVEKVSYKGGYVWNYTPDLSRRWGEMEAKPSMIWTQAPGTPTMGNVFLEAYFATGDEYYYNAAEKVADALISGQLPCGGWNYIIDFDGEESLKDWYETIGENGWRLEEFQHYYGNATFDDEATYGPALFLLRMYNQKPKPKLKHALESAIQFVLESQYPSGGWPQRYPLKFDYSKNNRPDYSSFITLNDDVHRNNVRFLLMCYLVLKEERFLEPINRAMNCILQLQQKKPQAGWSWQFTTDMKPAGARTYEPEGLYSNATYSCINMLMDYYEITGEQKFMDAIPPAIDFLKSIALSDEMTKYYPRNLAPGQKLYPSCTEVGTNKAVYVHRRGSNATNGEYYSDYNPAYQWMPTFSMRALNVSVLEDRFESLKKISTDELLEKSPLNSKPSLESFLPRRKFKTNEQEIERIISDLIKKDYWEGVYANSNPYIGNGPKKPTEGDYRCTQVGDKYDTSPYRLGEDQKGITTMQYVINMSKLIEFVNSQKEN